MIQQFYLLTCRGLLNIFRRPFYYRDLMEQMDYAEPALFLCPHGRALHRDGSFLQIAAEFAVSVCRYTQDGY